MTTFLSYEELRELVDNNMIISFHEVKKYGRNSLLAITDILGNGYTAYVKYCPHSGMITMSSSEALLRKGDENTNTNDNRVKVGDLYKTNDGYLLVMKIEAISDQQYKIIGHPLTWIGDGCDEKDLRSSLKLMTYKLMAVEIEV